MKIIRRFRRSIAAALLSAGLAWPACAAVCPGGIGGCPSPGRCFLFTDADGNAFCDYTSRSVSPSPSGTYPSGSTTPAQPQAPVTATATPVPSSQAAAVTPSASPVPATAHPTTASPQATAPVNDTASAGVHSAPGGGIPDIASLSVPLAGIFLFLVLTGAFSALIRTGVFRVKNRKTGPALALSALFSLGISLISACLLAGGYGSGTTYALIYMAAGSLLAGYLWYAGMMDRRIVLALAAMSAVAGFVFLAPIMPMEIGGIVNVLTGTSGLTAGILITGAVVLLALLVGRTFCGQICPVGALQELAYAVPVRKVTARRSGIPELARLVVFIATVAAAVVLVDPRAFTGLYDLFSLTLSAGLATAAGLVLISVFLYRPVCRILCPFGVLFSLPAGPSLFRMRRTEACISCRKCEEACPARVAGPDDPKRECYLCGRCGEACPVDGALVFGR